MSQIFHLTSVLSYSCTSYIFFFFFFLRFSLLPKYSNFSRLQSSFSYPHPPFFSIYLFLSLITHITRSACLTIQHLSVFRRRRTLPDTFIFSLPPSPLYLDTDIRCLYHFVYNYVCVCEYEREKNAHTVQSNSFVLHMSSYPNSFRLPYN